MKKQEKTASLKLTRRCIVDSHQQNQEARSTNLTVALAVADQFVTAVFVAMVAMPLLFAVAAGRVVLGIGRTKVRQVIKAKSKATDQSQHQRDEKIVSIDEAKKPKKGAGVIIILALFSTMMPFGGGCSLNFNWDQSFCEMHPTSPECVDQIDGDSVDSVDDKDEGETVPTCASYEKSCEVEGVLACIDPDTDKANCGGCGISCSNTQDCIQGVCGCPSGKSACGDECYNFLAEVLACGGCGTVCEYSNAGASCENGICQMGNCLENFYDCNNDPADGCESEHKDLENCGGCGVVCEYSNADSSCDGGTCEFLGCLEGFGDCDDDTSNGCEADLQSDAGNCGGCGTVCGTDDPWIRGCKEGSCACLCGNGICDDELERVDCPADCPYTPRCGDGFCDARNNAENISKCPEDCEEIPECGVSGCSLTLGENHNNCSDCANINYVLGDELCGLRENCTNSPADCGECNSCVYLE